VRKQFESGSPALRPLLDSRKPVGCQIGLRRAPQELECLLRSELQIVLTDLHNLTLRPPFGERKLRVVTGRDHHVHLGRLVFQQESDLQVNLQRGDQVIVIEARTSTNGNGTAARLLIRGVRRASCEGTAPPCMLLRSSGSTSRPIAGSIC